MFMLSRRQIEYLLRQSGAGETLLRELDQEEVRETVFQHLALTHTSRRSFAGELRISETGLREFLRYAPPGAGVWHALAGWCARRQRQPVSAAIVAVNVLARHAPPREIYQLRIHLIEAVRAVYLDAGCEDPIDAANLW